MSISIKCVDLYLAKENVYISIYSITSLKFGQLFFPVWYSTGQKLKACRCCLFSLKKYGVIQNDMFGLCPIQKMVPFKIIL